MPETFTQTGGARLGQGFWFAINWTWPFSVLVVTPQALTLNVFLKQYTFPKDTLRHLMRYPGFWAMGLQLVHTCPDYPPFIVFWTFDFEILKSELERCGYRVEENP